MRRFGSSCVTLFFLLLVVMIFSPPLVSSGAEEAGSKSAGAKLLVDRHAAKKINCQGCHDANGAPKAVSSDKCLKCHKSYEHVAELTKGREVNPHISHEGKVECLQCHKVHKESELFCNTCHNFDMKVP